MFLSYNLQLYITIDVMWPGMKDWLSHRQYPVKYGEYILRTGIVILTYLMAALVPCLEETINLVGSLSISSLALVFPPIIEIVGYMPGSYSLTPLGTPINTNEKHEKGLKHKSESCPNFESEAAILAAHEIQMEQLRRQGFQDENDADSCGFTWIVVKCIFIILLGLLASGVGTYVAITDIITAIDSGKCA